MKYKNKELKNYYNICTLFLFQWVKFLGWIEGKLRKISFKRKLPY